MIGPKSRYRVYGGLSIYFQTLWDIFLRKWESGNDVEELEKLVSKDFSVPHAIAVPMARMGIYLSVKYLIKPGQSVLMSPYTIADVVNIVIAAGGRPRFVDVELNSGNMDPTDLQKKITSDCSLILVTHLHGISADMAAIMKIAKDNDLPIVEDAAQAVGAKLGEKRVGTLGAAGVYSFGTYKNLNSWFGGMIVCHDDSLAHKIREEIKSWPFFPTKKVLEKLRFAAASGLLGWDPIFKLFIHRIFRYGFLFDVDKINRMVAIELDTSRRDELLPHYRSRYSPGQARLIKRQWKHLDADTTTRIKFAVNYSEELIPSKSLRKPPGPRAMENIYTYYPLQCSRRKNFLKWLMYFHRDIAGQHLKNCAHLDSFKEFYVNCPNAQEVADSVVLLPSYASYGNEEVAENIRVVNWFVKNGEPEWNSERRDALHES